MRKCLHRRQRIILCLCGGMLPLLGSCLPKDYFALSARAVAVSIANTLVASAVSPIYDALGVSSGSSSDSNTSDTTNNQQSGTADGTSP